MSLQQILQFLLPLLGGGASALGGILASEAQQANVQKALDLQKSIHDQTRGDLLPYMQGGQSSMKDLLAMTRPGYDYGQLANDPGYQFRMQQGQQALERSAAARGGLNSGGFMKDLDKYSQGLASDEFHNRFARLSSIAGLGENAAAGFGNNSQGYANSASSLYGAMGNAQAAGIAAPFQAAGYTLGQLRGNGYSYPGYQPIPTQGGG